MLVYCHGLLRMNLYKIQGHGRVRGGFAKEVQGCRIAMDVFPRDLGR
jgi:hypothetical protein